MIDWGCIIAVERWTVLALCLIGLAMMARGSWAAITGDISALNGFKLASSGIMVSLIGFQSGYLLEGVPDEPHWRIAANLLGMSVSLVVLLAVFGVQHAEKAVRTGHASPALCFWRRARRLFRGQR